MLSWKYWSEMANRFETRADDIGLAIADDGDANMDVHELLILKTMCRTKYCELKLKAMHTIVDGIKNKAGPQP